MENREFFPCASRHLTCRAQLAFDFRCPEEVCFSAPRVSVVWFARGVQAQREARHTRLAAPSQRMGPMPEEKYRAQEVADSDCGGRTTRHEPITE